MNANTTPPDSGLPTLSRAEVRELDRLAIEEFGLPGVVLMENAGRALAAAILEFRPQLQRALILCGAGNNGGDGYVVARYLRERGVQVTVIETAESELSPDAAVFRAVCAALALPLVAVGPGEHLSDVLGEEAQFDVVVDALLGTGFQGALRPAASSWLTELNELAAGWHAGRVAIDAPSGLDVDTGKVADGCFRADLTLTLSANKLAFDTAEGMDPAVRSVAGSVRVLGIEIPEAVYRALQSK